MSQTETIMLIILGFAIALLLALILGKLLWGQAIGLGKRRSRRDDPVTIAALQADKDKLRAEAAMLSRKLELRLNDLKTRLAEQTAEVSRNRNRVDRLAGEIIERDATITSRDQELENLKAQLEPLQQELVTRTQSAQQLKQQLFDKDEELIHKSSLINGLQEQLKGALATNVIAGQVDVSAEQRLQTRISDLTSLSKQIEDQRLQLTRQHSELKTLTGVITQEKSPPTQNKTNRDAYLDQLDSGSSKLEQQLKQAERETDELQEELAKLDEDWNEKLKQLESVKSSNSKPVKTPEKAIQETTEEPKQITAKQTTVQDKKATKKPAKKATVKATAKTTNKNSDKTGDKDKDDEASNVVSLASRIRSLQSDIKSQK